VTDKLPQSTNFLGGPTTDLLLNKLLLKTQKYGLNLLLYTMILSEKMDVKLPYVRDTTLTESLLPKDFSDLMLKKFSTNVNLRTLGSELNRNISYLLDKELLTDGL